MKKLMMLLVCALALSGFGCTGLIVSRATVPYETIKYPPKETRATVPYETKEDIKENFIPERLELIFGLPSGNYPRLKLGGRTTAVNPVEKNTVKKLQEYAQQTSQVIFINDQPILGETQNRQGRWVAGWFQPKTIFLAEIFQGPRGVKEYRLTRAGICWNPVRGITIKIHPAMLVVERRIVERYRDTVEQLIEARYRDVDYTPAIWAGLGGFFLGGVVGWLIHPAAAATNIYNNVTAGGGSATATATSSSGGGGGIVPVVCSTVGRAVGAPVP